MKIAHRRNVPANVCNNLIRGLIDTMNHIIKYGYNCNVKYIYRGIRIIHFDETTISVSNINARIICFESCEVNGTIARIIIDLNKSELVTYYDSDSDDNENTLKRYLNCIYRNRVFNRKYWQELYRYGDILNRLLD